MIRALMLVGALLLAGGAGYGGYHYGQRNAPQPVPAGAVATVTAPSGVPVPVDAAAQPKAERKIIFYRNPMGLPDTSPVPKKDWMGMDYIPVYEGEDQDSGSGIRISPEKVQKLGVRTEPAMRRMVMAGVRAVGSVQIDERRIVAVAPRFEGFIERLRVGATGDSVRPGQVLMEIYAPELVLAQEEYRIARDLMADASGAAARETANVIQAAAVARLRALGAPAELIRRLEQGEAPRRRIAIAAPTAGVVLEKMVVEGQRFAAGETLFRIADIGQVWVLADIFEQDLAQLRLGQTVNVKVQALPGRQFGGRIALIYPTVGRETRTAKVRVEIPNPDFALRADMYASVEIEAPAGALPAVTVPPSAVIDSGVRQVVLVERGEGRFEPRAVKLGQRGEDAVEILQGVEEGERVVVAANFLIDAESNLRAALQAFQPPADTPAPEAKP